MKYHPVIVVVAYNRPRSLDRLLTSLKNSKKIAGAKLIISIDNKAPENLPVKKIADDFEWPFGEKDVIYQEKRLGLRQHILTCGDLTQKYGSVIILEDDLYVSPYFYDYTVQALEYYEDDSNIAGISLFGQPKEDLHEMPFKAISDDSDVFFLQFPSSWGQAWSKSQWTGFRNWLSNTPDIKHVPISDVIIYGWPESSWKKLFCAYMKDQNKFFVYPRNSLTTNFNEPGTNYKLSINCDGQIPICITDSQYRFKKLSESLSIYDSYFELLPEVVKNFAPSLKGYDFEMDLYGHKEIEKIKTPYIITSRSVSSFLFSYKRALKPHDMNILLDQKGENLFFSKTSDVLKTKPDLEKRMSDYRYFYYRYLPDKNLYLLNLLKKIKKIF